MCPGLQKYFKIGMNFPKTKTVNNEQYGFTVIVNLWIKIVTIK